MARPDQRASEVRRTLTIFEFGDGTLDVASHVREEESPGFRLRSGRSLRAVDRDAVREFVEQFFGET